MKKRRVFDIIQLGNVSDTPSRAFDYFLVIVIILNIAAMFLETFDSMAKWYGLFEWIEDATVGVFLIEYILRLWTAEYLYPTKSKLSAALRYAVSFDGLVLLMSILPFFFLSGAVAFRMLRVVRIFHLFRVNQSLDSFNVIVSVLVEKRNQILSSLFIVLVLMLGSSMCMYSVEHAAQPDKFVNAFSGLWWSVSALLTVGYGDVYPITTLGRVMAVFISFLGVGAVAIPTGIISAGFVEQYTKAQGDARDIPVLTVRADMDSRWIGRTVREIDNQMGARILLIRRGKETFAPKDGAVIELNDVLYVFDSNSELRIQNSESMVRGRPQ